MRKIGEMLGDSVGRPEILRAARAQKVLRHWPEVVGDFLSSKTVPDRFERGTLWVAATGSSWAQELRMQKDDILAKLNNYAGEKLFENLRVGTRPPRRDWTLPPSAD